MSKPSEDDLLNNALVNLPAWARKSGFGNTLRVAKSFRLDDEMAKLVILLAAEKDKIPGYRSLAKLPYDTTWIEFNHTAAYNMRLQLGTVKDPAPANERPTRIGYLLQATDEDTWRVVTIAMDRSGTVDMFPMFWEVKTTGIYEKLTAALYKTQTAEQLAYGLREVPQSLVGSVKMGASHEWLEHYGLDVSAKVISEHLANIANELQGDVRFLCTCLAAINELPYEVTESKPRGMMLSEGRMREFVTHRTVTLKIPAKRKLQFAKRTLDKAYRLHKIALHQVRGHWRLITHKKDHYRHVPWPNGQGFDKVLIEAGTVERVWVRSHYRGDADVGVVLQDYEVTLR